MNYIRLMNKLNRFYLNYLLMNDDDWIKSSLKQKINEIIQADIPNIVENPLNMNKTYSLNTPADILIQKYVKSFKKNSAMTVLFF